METCSLVENERDDAACSEPYGESFPGREFERIDTARDEWFGIPAGTFILGLGYRLYRWPTDGHAYGEDCRLRLIEQQPGLLPPHYAGVIHE